MALCAVLLVGCASWRKTEIGTDKVGSYGLQVHNARTSSVTLYWDNAGSTQVLGTVSAGSDAHFTVPASSSSVKITARTSTGTTIGTYNVDLTSGSTLRIT
jgi:hypothetical protein